LLWLRTGRGAWHAEAIGADERNGGRGNTEFRSVLFWVNLARKDKQATPHALVLHKDQLPVRTEGDAVVRTLVGEGSPVQLGTPALILDVELPHGGQLTTPVAPEFQGFAYLVDGEAVFGANRRRARPPQLLLLGPEEELTVTDATPGTRFLLMAASPTGRPPCSTGRLWTRAAEGACGESQQEGGRHQPRVGTGARAEARPTPLGRRKPTYPLPARCLVTCSRTAGMTSSANRTSCPGSSVPSTKVSKPSSTTSPVSSSVHCPTGPRSAP
jgi:hypothetical protein